MATLFSSAREGVSLDDVLNECAAVFEGVGTALVYGPRDCVFACLGSNGKLAFSPRRPWPEGEPIFEARIFSPVAELRWLHQAGGIGRAAVLTEDAGLLERLGTWKEQEPIETMRPVDDSHGEDVRYLIWGTGTGEIVGDGWSRLAEPRIGALDVPVAGVERGRHAFLVSREYVVAEPDNGNAEVVEERLAGLEVDHA